MPTPEEVQDERRRERHVRLIVDFTCTVIMQTRMARTDAEGLVQAARGRILELFPGREETYDLLYAPRFRRILDEFAGPTEEEPHGRVITFPGRR